MIIIIINIYLTKSLSNCGNLVRDCVCSKSAMEDRTGVLLMDEAGIEERRLFGTHLAPAFVQRMCSWPDPGLPRTHPMNVPRPAPPQHRREQPRRGPADLAFQFRAASLPDRKRCARGASVDKLLDIHRNGLCKNAAFSTVAIFVQICHQEHTAANHRLIPCVNN
jgi:hypothetical protein